METPESPPTSPAAPARAGRGMFWMLVTGVLFVGVTATVKHMDGSVPAAQAAFLRYALGLVFLIPLLPALRKEPVSAKGWRLMCLRGAVHSFGVMLWFYAMAAITIAEVTAMNYMTPVYTTLGAALFLGERLRLRRIMAIAAALVGVLIILRPGFRALDPGHLAMVGTAITFGASYLMAKRLTGQMSPVMIVSGLSITVTIGLLPFALVVWVPPSWGDLGWLFLVAALATAGHYTMTLAFAAAPISVTQPVVFLQLVWAVSLGALVFGEPVDGWVVIGGMVIFSAVLFLVLREAQLKARAHRGQ